MTTFPTIHMNGTSAKSLILVYDRAFDAIEQAIAALKQTTPNMRDYYPQGQAAFDNATTEHLARIGKLVEVQTEIETLMGHAYDNTAVK